MCLCSEPFELGSSLAIVLPTCSSFFASCAFSPTDFSKSPNCSTPRSSSPGRSCVDCSVFSEVASCSTFFCCSAPFNSPLFCSSSFFCTSTCLSGSRIRPEPRRTSDDSMNSRLFCGFLKTSFSGSISAFGPSCCCFTWIFVRFGEGCDVAGFCRRLDFGDVGSCSTGDLACKEGRGRAGKETGGVCEEVEGMVGNGGGG